MGTGMDRGWLDSRLVLVGEVSQKFAFWFCTCAQGKHNNNGLNHPSTRVAQKVGRAGTIAPPGLGGSFIYQGFILSSLDWSY